MAEAGRFGRTCLVRGALTGPNGGTGRFILVWLLDSDEAGPRFNTACAEQAMFELLDTVVMIRDVSESGLRRGDPGAIVGSHGPEDFEVEFVAV